MSALRRGTAVNPAFLQKALFFPDDHLHRQAAGQSIQSGEAMLQAAASTRREAMTPPAIFPVSETHLARILLPDFI